jgi:hypothetical protein
MNQQKLSSARLDFLLVDVIEEDRVDWISEDLAEGSPDIIIWMVPSKYISDDTTGPFCSHQRKFFRQRGYTMRSWHMCADQYGAALRQDRAAVVYFKAAETTEGGPLMPASSELPARSMSNMLSPTGIPRRAWKTTGSESACDAGPQKRHLPCKTLQQFSDGLIYEQEGPMTDAVNVWVRSERGVWRLITEELAKAKGIPSSWMKKGPKVKAPTITQITCLHLWTAAVDAARNWWNREDYDDSTLPGLIQRTSSSDDSVGFDDSSPPGLFRRTNDDDSLDSDYPSDDDDDWLWEVPDLSKGSACTWNACIT